MLINLPYRLIKKSELDEISLKLKEVIAVNKKACQYILKIENNELDENSISQQDKENELLLAISSLHQKMKSVAVREEQQNWVANGLAQFIDLLRKNNDDSKKLADIIISNVVKYMKANQGGIFIVNDEDTSDVFLELAACYAYGRKKFISKRIEIGTGLVGQCYLEGGKILLTDVPKNYVQITSGLGEATPTCLLLMPLKLNDQVMGVIEIAAFSVFKNYEIEFLEKLSEIIASTIADKKTSARTTTLLQQAQQHAEEMRAQEEEIMQNMEEMEATQEEMRRKQVEIEKLLEESKQKEVAISKMALQNNEEREKLKAEIDVLKFQMKRKDKKLMELGVVS